MDSSQFSTINEKLDKIIKLLGLQIIKDKPFREQVELLSSTGMQNKEIAELTGKTPNNIKVTLHSIRKSKKKKEGK